MHSSHALLLAFAALLPTGARASFVTTKRVFATTNSSADYGFYLKYIGAVDNSSTHSHDSKGKCLDRNLAFVLPDNFGIHFPQSYRTNDGAATGGRSMEEWDQLRAHATSATYSAFHDHATSLFIPDLGKHVAMLLADKVPILTRLTADVEGAGLFSIMVSTPGSGQVFEFQSPKCSGCTLANFKKFSFGECAQSHVLTRPTAYYSEAWDVATASKYVASTLPNGLPAALLTQIRVALSKVEQGSEFIKTFYNEKVQTTNVRLDCKVGHWETGVAPFEYVPKRALPGYFIDYVFVENPNAVDNDEWIAWEKWANKLHEEYVGAGFGFDRVLDYHVKIMANGSDGETSPGVAIDHWASMHEAQGMGYHVFNLSNGCPGTRGPPFSGGMIYSTGIGGIQGIEFWGNFDGSKFDAATHELFGWNDCSPSMGCTYTAPKPMCEVAGATTVSVRVPQDWPTRLSAAEIACPHGAGNITKIKFVSLGLPHGECMDGFTAGSCSSNAKLSLAAASKLCVSRASCSVPADERVFPFDAGSPCAANDTVLELAISAECGGGSGS
jgi:hypothetical protein